MLKERLLDTQALMNDLATAKDAEKSQLVSRWIQKLKAVAYSAEDLMDEYAYEMLRRKHQGWEIIQGCRNFLRPSSNRIVFRSWMAHRIKNILSELDQLYTDPNVVGLQLAGKAASASTSAAAYNAYVLDQTRRSPTASLHHHIKGRERDLEILLDMVLNPHVNGTELPFISIVGIGGLGKTTLARQLYEHEKVDGQFDQNNKHWICVSEDFHVEKILKEMVESLMSTKCDLTNTDAIMKKIQEELKGKKFFLVLDDVWNDNNQLWESLKIELHRIGGLIGSVVLITTRSHGVANACASNPYELKGLSEKDGWDLLKEQVFDNTIMPYDSSFDDIGKRIAAEKCKGVPLAIKSIGSLLQSKQHISDWLSLEKSELWNIKADDRNYLMPSLLLSYNHINPVNVRQCFAYCAIFPKDTVMEKGELIALWLAQGLINDEASGENCFDIIVNCSFLEKESDDYQAKYKMHDLVHDLATYVLKKELLVWKAKDEIDVVDAQVRHLVFNLQEDEIALETLAKEQMRKLRTISFWKGMSRWNSLICARNMRTLVMVNVGLKEVPSLIGQLVHLRYLDLSENNMEALPESMCKLYQLQTLRLLHCTKLEELPEKLHKLRNLRHIQTSYYVSASRGLRKLTCLQSLPYLGLRDGKGWTIDELGPLDQVKGDLCINNLEFVKNKEEAKGAMLWRKDKILKLELCWGGSREGHNDEVVLDGLEPYPNIQSLEISGFSGVKFPRWIMAMKVGQSGHATQLCYLTNVTLTSCRRCRQLPSLGHLSKLRILRLSGFDEVESIGEEIYEDNNNVGDIKVLFPALKELYLGSFKSVTTWMPPSSTVATRSCFPELETLEIEDCPELERVPSLCLKSLKHLSLNNVGLNSLKVVGMNEMVSQSEELLNCINLQTLEIIDCKKVKWIHIEDAAQLTSVKLSKCVVCQKLPSFGQLPKLTLLELEEFDEVECIGGEFYGDSNNIIGGRKVLFPELRELRIKKFKRLTTWMAPWLGVGTSVLPKLESLEIWICTLLETVPALQFESLKELQLKYVGRSALDIIKRSPSLNSLGVMGVDEMVSLPEELSNCMSLQTLDLHSCKKLERIPSGMISLKRLSVMICPSLGSIEEGVLQGLSSLRDLDIWNCLGLKRMPKSLEDCTSLEMLCIADCPSLQVEAVGVPDIGKLRGGLTYLILKNAGGMMAYIPRWIPQLHRLHRLEIFGWGEDWDMSLTSSLPSLTSLELWNFPNIKARQHMLPPSLEYLIISGFEEMEALPDWLGGLSSLQSLFLWDCKKLKYLPSKPAISRLTRLRDLYIVRCPELEQRCDKHKNGPEWPKISHLPEIRINDENVQDP